MVEEEQDGMPLEADLRNNSSHPPFRPILETFRSSHRHNNNNKHRAALPTLTMLRYRSPMPFQPTLDRRK